MQCKVIAQMWLNCMAVSYTLTNPWDLPFYQAAVEGSQSVDRLLSDSRSRFSETMDPDTWESQKCLLELTIRIDKYLAVWVSGSLRKWIPFLHVLKSGAFIEIARQTHSACNPVSGSPHYCKITGSFSHLEIMIFWLVMLLINNQC